MRTRPTADDRQRPAAERGGWTAPPLTRASPAPSTPVAPHAAICHGVHGPWPKKKLDASPAIAPTANPGPPPSA